MLAQFERAGIDVDALAAQLQEEGKEAFIKSWDDLLKSIDSEREQVARLSATRSRVSERRADPARGPAWKALEAHFARDRATSTCATSSPTTRSAASA